MPIATAGSSQVKDLAEVLQQKINDRSGGSANITDHEVALGWTTGGPNVLGRYVDSSAQDGLSFTAVRIGASATPAGKVLEGAAKPAGTTLESFEVRQSKYAGISTFSTEQALTTVALMPALANALFSQALVAFDVDSVAALAADNGGSATGATWSSAILAAYADVIANGGNPDLLVMSGSDYAAAIESPGSGYVLSPVDAVPSLFGLRIAVTVGSVPGTAYVLDSKAVICVENSSTPAVIVDPYHSLSTNEVRLAAEFFAATVVCNPGSVIAVTVTAGGATRGGGSGRKSDFVLGA